ncbi:MAG: bacteriocin [Iphinoe sp. HA4291-MV1]|jgi:bacteriocin-like protein|nr:bacteriocin [Iphinoe sp. HA4291-MV1]
MDNQNLVNNNPQFEEFLENLHSLTDEELQSIYGGIGVELNVDVAGLNVDVDVNSEVSSTGMQ